MKQNSDLIDIRNRMMTRFSAAPLPPMVILDVTNTCNLQCIHCPQPKIQRDKGFKSLNITWDNFSKIVQEIATVDDPILLRLAGDGEPMIHPQIIEMVEYAKKNSHATVDLTTNGMLMDPLKVDRLLEAGIDLIDFSIDAFSKPVYEVVRRGGKYEKLIASIFHFLHRRNSLRKKTKIAVSFVVQEENAEEVEMFKKFWAPVVDDVLIRQLHSAVGQVKSVESASRNEASIRERFPCPHLWKRLTVDFRGTIKFCAHDWVFDEGVALGNIEQVSLKDAWSGQRLAGLRKNHLDNNFPPNEVCTRCTDWASTQWELGFERLVDRVVFEKPTLVKELGLDE